MPRARGSRHAAAAALSNNHGRPAFFQWLKERYPTMMHEVLEGESLDKAEANAKEESKSGPVVRPPYLDLNGIVPVPTRRTASRCPRTRTRC